MKLKLLVIDVDGTLTDSSIYYDENGNELKKFCTKDAAGFFAAKACGIKTMILTGRECKATTRRMKEMKVDYLYQNVKDKYNFLNKFIQEKNIKHEEIGYIGDDLNDLQPMRLAGFKACPSDSCKEVLNISDYISDVSGGHGVVRDVVEYVLSDNNIWEEVVSQIYGSGI
jgi:3-deoxy-D-manno-octulosonate 8-phosphate phosphatase (KDO 8-P phosphatase)